MVSSLKKLYLFKENVPSSTERILLDGIFEGDIFFLDWEYFFFDKRILFRQVGNILSIFLS